MSDTATAVATNQTAVAPPAPKRAPIAIGAQGLQVGDFDQLWRFATIASQSGLAPKGIQTPEAIFIAVQMGMEVGLTPMASLQNIAVINGRPSIWGDAQLGIVRGTGELEKFEEYFVLNGKRLELPDGTPRTPTPKELDDETCSAVCVVKRRGFGIASGVFSIGDAKQAKLIPGDPSSPWTKYRSRMLRFRARSFLLRDQFGDALKGIPMAEEANDLPIIEVDTVRAKRKELAPSLEPVGDDNIPTDSTPAGPPPPAPGVAPAVNPTDAGNISKETAPASDPQSATGEPQLTDAQSDIKQALELKGISVDDLLDFLVTKGLVPTRIGLESIADVRDSVIEKLQTTRGLWSELVKKFGKDVAK